MDYMHTTIRSSSSNTTAACTAVTKANSVNVEFSGTVIGEGAMLNQNTLLNLFLRCCLSTTS
jgi:hypothetical protein